MLNVAKKTAASLIGSTPKKMYNCADDESIFEGDNHSSIFILRDGLNRRKHDKCKVILRLVYGSRQNNSLFCECEYKINMKMIK
jgi:hypothetical protein